jgi:hypothetical protein
VNAAESAREPGLDIEPADPGGAPSDAVHARSGVLELGGPQGAGADEASRRWAMSGGCQNPRQPGVRPLRSSCSHFTLVSQPGRLIQAMATDIIDLPRTGEQHDTAELTDLTALRPNPFGLLDHRAAINAVSLAQAMPGHYLAITDGDGDEHLLRLDDAITHVGRAVASDLRFEDVHVSRRHAIVVRYGDHVRVLDDRSSAGTFVNGRRVIATDLTNGDVVRLGTIAFTYVHVR